MTDTAQNVSLEFYPPGSTLIPQGGELGTLFVLRTGQVEIERDGAVLSTIGKAGAVFGEMSILLGKPHSATVRAITPVEVFVIQDALEVLAARPAWTLNLARLLAQRLDNTSARLAEAERPEHHDDGPVLPAGMFSQMGDPSV